MAIPTREEALNLLEKYNTPSRAKNHCIEVSRVAVLIGEAYNEAINNSGEKSRLLNISLIEAAGISHDMVRQLDNHGEKAAEILEELGYEEVAEIVYGHMKYKFTEIKFEEVDIVCLADRLVLEDKYAGVDVRMTYVIEKYKHLPEVAEKIKGAIEEIKVYIAELEKVIKKPLEEIMLSKS